MSVDVTVDANADVMVGVGGGACVYIYTTVDSHADVVVGVVSRCLQT